MFFIRSDSIQKKSSSFSGGRLGDVGGPVVARHGVRERGAGVAVDREQVVDLEVLLLLVDQPEALRLQRLEPRLRLRRAGAGPRGGSSPP